MHNLTLLDPAPAGSLTTAEIDLTMAYAEAEKAPATREAYASDSRDFAASVPEGAVYNRRPLENLGGYRQHACKPADVSGRLREAARSANRTPPPRD